MLFKNKHPSNSKYFRMQGKQEIQEIYVDWLANGKHEYMAAGNTKLVPMRLVVEWSIKSWEEISNETVANSMKSCALAFTVDGTEGKDVKKEERYWKVKCGCSPIINFTKIFLKFIQKILSTQHHFLRVIIILIIFVTEEMF